MRNVRVNTPEMEDRDRANGRETIIEIGNVQKSWKKVTRREVESKNGEANGQQEVVEGGWWSADRSCTWPAPLAVP